MATLRIRLDAAEDVVMRTHDNKALHHRCTKLVDGVPVLDLVPRARYLLRALPLPDGLPAGAAAAALFEHALLLEPWPEPDGSVRRVVVVNLADRLYRLQDGQPLGDRDAPSPR
jgi:hypothetical protein